MRVESFAIIPHDSLHKTVIYNSESIRHMDMKFFVHIDVLV